MWIILIIAIIALALFFLAKTPAEAVSSKVQSLRRKIRHDLALLKLAKERRIYLERKAQMVFRCVAITVTALFLLINSLLIYSGIHWVSALEGTMLVITSLTSISSIIVFNKLSVNAILDLVQKQVILWIYRRNGFSTESIRTIELRITTSKHLLNKEKTWVE